MQVNRFKQMLRHDLLASMSSVRERRLRQALVVAGTAATVFGALLIAFIIAPGIPDRLHAALLHPGEMAGPARAAQAPPARIPAAPASGQPMAASLHAATLRRLLETSSASAQRDRTFLESWYEEQARPVRVEAVEGEHLVAIRQFTLSNGESVAVLTDLGALDASRQAHSIQTASRTF